MDAMRWYCRECRAVVWEKRFICTDLGTQVKEVVEEFAADAEKRRCGACGTVAKAKYDAGEVEQPPRYPD
jgi:3-hydroxyanthranilate 3,4-dioxygenase